MGPCFKCKYHVRVDYTSFCKKELNTPKYVKIYKRVSGKHVKEFNHEGHEDCIEVRYDKPVCNKFQKEVWYKRIW